MTENKKNPYLQCLYHTGKKVYKYWLAALAVIGVIIGFYFVVASAWKQIENGLNTIVTALGYVGSIIILLFSNAWSLACSVPWYWWVAVGITIGPFILVAIWCALKHYNVEMNTFLTITTITSVIGAGNFIYKSFYMSHFLNEIDVIVGTLSIMWLTFITIITTIFIMNIGDSFSDRW